jgi:galactonate dehydratase
MGRIITAHSTAELLAHDAVHIIQLSHSSWPHGCQTGVAWSTPTTASCPHSAQGPLCSLVCAHLNTATPNFFIHEIFDDFNEDWSNVILTNPVRVKDGYIELEEDRIGWGTDLNYEEIAKHPYNPNNFLPLFRSGWEKRQPVGSKQKSHN